MYLSYWIIFFVIIIDMKQLKTETDSTISSMGRKVLADELGCVVADIQVVSVDGGYSRNRRSLVGYANRWIFAKEVDNELLSGDGEEELRWLRKDYECTNILRQIIPEIVPEWGKLVANKHILLMPSYRAEDGWLWSLPSAAGEQRLYIQAVINATKQLETAKFSQDDIDNLKLQPYFRDKLALDDGLALIIHNDEIRNQLEDKYAAMVQDGSLIMLRPAIRKMQVLLQDKRALRDLSIWAASLIEQPSDYFGHCDVRSDNIAYNPSTGQVKFIDWNWASFASAKFGSTEFLVDMARRGVDITTWIKELNPEMLAAVVGYYAKRCLQNPLSPENTLRDMQAQSAAVALDLYDMAVNQ